MKRQLNIISVIMAGILLIFLSGCNPHKSPAAITELRPAFGALEYVPQAPSTGNNYFALDLYGELKKTETGNIFFSPFSIFSAMSMTGEGARNGTWDEMKAVLHLQEDNSTRWNAFLQLINTINDPNKQYQLKTANNLWLEKTMTFLPAYLNTAQVYYLAELTNMDFIYDSEASRVTINARVEQQTEGKIKDLLPAGCIDPYTRLVLTNAIYFKATWLHKFTKESTFAQNFYTSPGNAITVQMMHQKLTGIIGDFYGKAKVLELPYLGNEVSMFVFLPDQGGMAALESVTTIDNITSWMAERTSGTSTYIDLSLPKFKVETRYTLNDVLSNMGMPSAFNGFGADFSGMNGYGGLYISTVVHKAFVAVDEEGTEAAAATGVVVSVNSVPPPAVPFTVDHPFIFMICENSTGAILFMGRVNEPGVN